MNTTLIVIIFIITILLILYYIKLNEINSFLIKNIEKLELLNLNDKYIEKLINFINENKDGIYRLEDFEIDKTIKYFTDKGYIIKEIDSEKEQLENETENAKHLEFYYIIKDKWDVKRKFLIVNEDNYIIPEGLIKIKNTNYKLINTSENIKIIKIYK